MAHPGCDIDAKVALLSDAASGLGIEFAEAMAEAGAHVACADLQDASVTAERAHALGHEASAIGCNVTDEASLAAMVAAVVERSGRVDILVNTAGIADAAPGPLHDYPSENGHQVIDVDRHGVFHRAKHCPKVTVSQGSGRSSTSRRSGGSPATRACLRSPADNAAKGAGGQPHARTRSGVCDARHPGERDLPSSRGFSAAVSPAGPRRPRLRHPVSRFTPTGRVADAREIRDPAIFLVSNASSYMTGQLVLDGGVLAQ